MKSILKTIAIIAMVTMSVTANAQQAGDMAVGGHLALGTGSSLSNFGIGAKFQYNVTEPIRLEGSFTYFFKTNLISMWDFGVNAHWLFPVSDKVTVYPLAGLGLLGTTLSYDYGWGLGTSVSATDFAFTLGGGIDYPLNEKFVINGELKYKIVGTWNRLILSAGVAYRL